MRPVELLTTHRPGMTLAERAALEGLLARVRPKLSVEIGTFRGGSLERVAAWSDEVLSFDMDPRVDDPPTNVTFHAGDSHVLLPSKLAELEREGRSVDFALVDGDHSREGTRRDVENLLRSSAVSDCLIVLHDTMNEDVRGGVAEIELARYPHVVHLDMSFLEVPNDKLPLQEWWSGLGIIVVDRGASQSVDVLRPASLYRAPAWRLGAWRAARRTRIAKRRAAALALKALDHLPARLRRELSRRRGSAWHRGDQGS